MSGSEVIIALIVVGSVLVLVVIFIIIWKCVISKRQNNSDIIGSLVDHRNDDNMKELSDKIKIIFIKKFIKFGFG